jgi:hypothetical protein
MLIKVKCPGCGAKMRGDESFAEKQVKCPACRMKFQVGTIPAERQKLQAAPPVRRVARPPEYAPPPVGRELPQDPAPAPARTISQAVEERVTELTAAPDP